MMNSFKQFRHAAGIAVFAFTGLLNSTSAEDRSVELSRRMYAFVVVAKMAGFDTVFTIDTGAGYSGVTGPQSLIDKPDKTWVISQVGIATHSRRRFVQQIDGIGLQLFNLPETRTKILFVPQAEVLRATVTTQNVLGLRDLRDFQIHMNLRTGVCERVTKMPSEMNSTLVKLKYPLTDGATPRIRVRFPTVGELEFIYDSGSSFFLTMDFAYIALLRDTGLLQKAGVIHGFTRDGLIEVRTHILKSCEIAGFEFADVLVLESSANTLGSEFIDCFDTTIDFPKREMRLKPLETEWPLRIPPDASGLILSYRDTDLLLVVRMEPDSAAVRSGLLEGDRVLLFDGKSPKDTSMRTMRKRLTEAGTTVKLKILRDGKELDIDLPLSRSYEYPPKWPELNTDADDFFKSLQNEKKPKAE